MNLKDEIKEQRSLSFSDISILATMVGKGYPIDDVRAMIKEVLEEEYEDKKKRNPILYNKYLPVIVLIFLYWFYFHFLSVYAINEYTTFLTISGGILFAIFISMAIFRLFPSVEKTLPYLIPITFIATIFLFGFIFIKFTIDAKTKELKEYGIITDANILDGRSITSRKYSDASLKVYFETEDKTRITTKIEISASELDRHYQGETIVIVYSKRDPNVVDIVRNPADWLKNDIK